jgi:cytochrome c553
MRFLLLLVLFAPLASAQEQPDRKGLEFFEKKVRPILVERCYKCHSAQAEKLKGGLYLDSREGVLKGGDLGPAIVPGDIEKSRLVKAVRWSDEDLQMPPKQKLAAEQVADLEAWVKMGAPDPRSAASPAPPKKQIGLSIAEGRKFWAYRPPERPALPSVRDAGWPKSEIDRFVLSRLESAGLRPAPAAEKDVLLRRLTYDLIGLPPSPEEVDAFVRDGSPDAYEKVVDRLLASRQFGERWGRHWLDVARFAESLTLRGFIMKEAWRYRDYVIEAFNADVPFDRFVREQIAGDLLPAGSLEDRRRQIVATAFLMMGNTNLEEQDKKQLEMDAVDEQLDAVSRAFLAQTVTCARCHDHKFDPIPTRDYYAMAGILKNSRMLEHANVSKWIEAPLPMEPAREAEAKKHEEAVAALEARIKAEKAKTAPPPKLEPGKTPKVLAIADVHGLVVDDAQAVKVGEWMHSTHTGAYIGAGYLHDKNEGKGEKSLTFDPDLPDGKYEVRFAYSPGTSRATNVPVTILSADGEKTVAVNEQENPPVEGRYVSLGQYRFENNQGYVIVSNDGTKGHVTADAVVFIPADKVGAPAGEPKPAKETTATARELEAEFKKLQESGPKRDMAMALREEKEIRDVRIHVRGSVHNLGDPAPRGFLQVAVMGDAPAIPADRSGRLELAEWLAGRANPLTARVFANRAWHWLFGAGLVRTTDNFGTTGERPSHPELLDWLALRFVEGGWSVKKLVRLIVTSSTYRMSSAAAKAPDADPENRLLWRMNRRRMDAECIRDTLLRVSGRLKLEGGGPSYPASLAADYAYKHADPRRSVYVPVFRNSLPEIFEVFDFGDASVVNGRRDVSTVAPQALFLLNNPFVADQARGAAERLLAERHADDRARVERAYRWALGRRPTDSEAAVALRHASGDPRAAWASIFHALFCSIESRFVD